MVEVRGALASIGASVLFGALFLLPPMLGPLAGIWIVKGNLNYSYTLDFLPLTDPYVALQAAMTGHFPEKLGLIGLAIVLVFYFLVGGRVYCSWVCPVNLVTDAAGWLRDRLGMDETRLRLTYQSRFGPEEWLQPYTAETVAALARSGVRDLAVVTPGFVADCLETIEEIGVENADIFRAAGGQRFTRIDCLNDSDDGLDVLEAVVRRELSGWI